MPIKTKKVHSIESLGTVNFGGKVLVTDPCYQRDEWCSCQVDEVLPGAWDGYAIKQSFIFKSYSTPDVRTAILIAHHRDHPVKSWSTCWEHLSGNIGVDSGQAGLFDLKQYPKTNDGAYDDTRTFYGRCCKVTLDDQRCGSVREGLLSASGFGDGCYDLEAQRDAKGRIVAMALLFLPFSGMWRAMATPKAAQPSVAA
jgi:hypothetical protein